jgi:hypothetical protein
MTTLEHSGVRVVYYSTSKEMPAARWKDFQKYLYEDYGVGSNMQALDMRLANTFQFIANDMKEKALQELYNLRMTANYVINKLSIKSFALAIIIHELDGQVLYDTSEAGLHKVVEKLEKLQQQVIEHIVEDVKKKLSHS